MIVSCRISSATSANGMHVQDLTGLVPMASVCESRLPFASQLDAAQVLLALRYAMQCCESMQFPALEKLALHRGLPLPYPLSRSARAPFLAQLQFHRDVFCGVSFCRGLCSAAFCVVGVFFAC